MLPQSLAVRQQANKELASLVQTKGWGYAQLVANEIQQEFECKPSDPNPEKWKAYTTVQYALNQFFSKVRIRAAEAAQTNIPGQSILAEIQEDNADRTRGERSSGPSAARPSSRRASARK